MTLFYLTILPLNRESRSLRTASCSITDRRSYVTRNATWGVLGGFKRGRTKGICPLSGEMSFGRAKLAIALSFLNLVLSVSKARNTREAETR